MNEEARPTVPQVYALAGSPGIPRLDSRTLLAGRDGARSEGGWSTGRVTL